MSKINELGQKILKSKYYAPGEETPEELFGRVSLVCSIPDVIDKIIKSRDSDSGGLASSNTQCSKAFAPYEELYKTVVSRRLNADFLTEVGLSNKEIEEIWKQESEKYYKMMCDLDFMPATPILLNAGRTGMLSSCFFMRVPDSIDGIFSILHKAGLVLKAGGGVGFDFSEVRPAGSKIKGTNGSSTGPISYMKIYNQMGEQISQGSIRSAAMMAVLRADHPDILEFIKCKETEGDLKNFNISVSITDEFMSAVEAGDSILLNHEKCSSSEKIDARGLWNEIVGHAWKNGEPGIIFEDTVAKGDVFKGKYGKLGPNACSELMLLDFGSCNLAAINLSNMVDTGGRADYNKLRRVTELGIRFLDNVVDLNNYPLPEIETTSLMTRRIGLGVTGLHDMLLKRGLLYGSDASVGAIEDIYDIIQSTAKEESIKLGETRGVPPVLEEINLLRRNTGLLTAQPTGSVSMILNQVSSGIEPVNRWKYTRKDTHGLHEMKHSILEKFGDDLPDYAKTALEIYPQDHIKVQAAIQKYICSGISKTVNMINGASVAEVENTFLAAHKSDCKSITVYRDGSRAEEVLIGKPKNVIEEKETKTEKLSLRHRPRVLFGVTFRINTPSGRCFVTVNEDKEGMREVFIHISKAGSEVGTHVESNGRLISNSLKYRIPAASLISHLEGQKSSPVFEYGEVIKSVPDAVAKAMKEYIEEWEGFSEYIEDSKVAAITKGTPIVGEHSGGLCPECGEVLYTESKCEVCHSCGYSQCG